MSYDRNLRRGRTYHLDSNRSFGFLTCVLWRLRNGPIRPTYQMVIDGSSRVITLIAQAIGDEHENLKDMFEYVLDSFIAE